MTYKIRFKDGKLRVVVVVDGLEIMLPFEYETFDQLKYELSKK